LTQALLQAVFENTDNAIVVLDAERRVVLYNRRFAEMWHLDPSLLDRGPTIEELIRVTCARGLYPREQQDALIRRRLERLDTCEPRVVIETPRLDGVVVEGYASRLEDGGYLLSYRDVTDRAQTAQALEESEARYRAVLEAMQDLVYIYSRDLRIEYLNPAMVRLLGRNGIGESCHLTLHGLESPCPWCPAEAVIGQGRPTQWEGVRPLDGRNYSTSSVPLVHADGRVSGLAVIRDVTERINAAWAVRQQMEFTRNLIQSSAVATFVVDREHSVRFWNRACEELTGIPATEMVGTDRQWMPFYASPRPCLADVIIDQRGDRLEDLYPSWGPSRLVADGLRAEGWYGGLGGQTRYIVFEAAPIRDADGDVVAAVETIQDFTAHQRAKEELVRLARAVEQAVEAVVITDSQFRIQYLNPAAQRMSGYECAAAQGQDLRHAFCRAAEGAGAHPLTLALDECQPWSGTFRHRHRNGTVREAECTVSPVTDDSGAVANWVALLHDVTRQAELEHHLALSQKLTAIGTLAGGIAHDFNNLLTATLGYTELGLEALGEGHRAGADLARVLQAGERARDLVAKILAFSREHREERGDVELAPLIQETIDFLRASTPSSVEIRTLFREHDLIVHGDASQLQQVALNLGSNALQAIGGGNGLIEFDLESAVLTGDEPPPHPDLDPGRYVVLHVSDSGCGIPADVLSRIFDPFFTTKEVGAGTGMGLSVVHGVVRAHGGAVFVESRSGKGSRFTVYLPRSPSPSNARVVPPPSAATSGSGRVLLVDDEPMLAELLGQTLESLGYECHATTSPLSALETLRKQPEAFDLLLTDQAMPRMNGEALTRAALELRPDLPIILITGYADGSTEDRFRDLGIRQVLLKPIRRQDLADALANVLGAPMDSRRNEPCHASS
jgi:PAS domain S-box-containing protein